MIYRTLLLVLFLAPAFAPPCFAQSIDKQKEEALRLGHLLYRLEKAAWNGTDLVRAQAPEMMEDIGGYITYPDGDLTHFTFYDRADPPGVVASLTFDSTFSNEVAVSDYSPRPLTSEELRLMRIRASGGTVLQQDTSVRVYKNTNLNLIPLVDDGQAKMYVLTGPQVSGVVVFGNDYLVSYDGNDNATKVRPLHQNIIPIEYETEGEPTKVSFHNHNESTGPIMTATDICTLLLYGSFTGWERHQVISEEYMSVWSISQKGLGVISRDVLEKISNDQEKREKKRNRKKKKKN